MAVGGTPYSAYKQVNVETASQGKLIVLLFNGAIQRAEEAKRLIIAEPMDIPGIHESLIRAQDIISELRNALDMSAGEVSENLDRSYEYFHHLLVQANMTKEVSHLEECIPLMTTIRDTWEELFENLREEDKMPQERAAINPHGSTILNIRS